VLFVARHPGHAPLLYLGAASVIQSTFSFSETKPEGVALLEASFVSADKFFFRFLVSHASARYGPLLDPPRTNT